LHDAGIFAFQDRVDVQGEKAGSSVREHAGDLHFAAVGGFGKSARLEDEFLDGSNRYFSNACGKKTKAVKNLRMSQIPPLLNIQLKRFAFSATNQNVKLNHYVKFPLEINLAKYSATDTKRAISNDETYQLYGIIVHTGPSADLRNYFCYIRSPQHSQWYKMDDTFVLFYVFRTVLIFLCLILVVLQKFSSESLCPVILVA
jgi:uncharacterized UBP type Zn finger protein